MKLSTLFLFHTQPNLSTKPKRPFKPALKSVLAVSLLALLGVSVTGCQSTKGTTYSGYDVSDMSPLQIVSQESQKALNAQALLTKYKYTLNSTLDTRQKSFENDKLVVDYIGKPQPLLSSFAIKYGYRFLEMGNSKDLPTINFTNYYATPQDVLVFIDAQLGDQASVFINKTDKTITLSYK